MAADPNRVNWDACTTEKITEMVSRRVSVDAETGALMVQTHLRRGALVALHRHAGQQWIQVTQGSIVVTMNGIPRWLGAGESVTIPAGTPHQIEAAEDSVVVDVRPAEAIF
jgi:quercetin dioxygenase-like cupin family protein